MLELREYTKSEISNLLGSPRREAITRKLDRWGVTYVASGRGDSLKMKIINIPDPFKVYAMLDLGCGANTDFQKLREYYYYYFNDEEFRNMPDEEKERRLDEENHHISRQTISNYTDKLERKNFISRNSGNYYYYFAYRQTQRIVTIDEYKQAWRDYWNDKDYGYDSLEAIIRMRIKYGGVARKQGIPVINAIYNDELEYMLNLIQESIENEIE